MLVTFNVVFLLHRTIAKVYTRKNPYSTPMLTSNERITVVYIKAAVRNFCLFVALYVWKPGIAVSCGIIFRARGCDPVLRHGSSAD